MIVLFVAAIISQSPLVVHHVEETGVKQQPEVHLYLRLPDEKKDASDVRGVLAYCTYRTEENLQQYILRTAEKPDGTTERFIKFADENNLALITWGTRTLWDPGMSSDEQREAKNKMMDKNFSKVSKAWEKGIRHFAKKYNLPKENFMIYGTSRGAQWAHRLVLRKPEYFLAIHAHINSSYDTPVPEGNSVMWLFTTGERENGYEASQRFYKKAWDYGYPIILKAGENAGHTSTFRTRWLSEEFFEYALYLKDNFKKPQQWTEAPYYGDFISQEVFLANQKDFIPEEQRIPLPTKELASAWGRLVSDPDDTHQE